MDRDSARGWGTEGRRDPRWLGSEPDSRPWCRASICHRPGPPPHSGELQERAFPAVSTEDVALQSGRGGSGASWMRLVLGRS